MGENRKSYLSNDLFYLAEKLLQNLEKAKLPKAQHTILLPSRELQCWLENFLLEKSASQSLVGIDFVLLPRFSREFCSFTKNKIPTHEELYFSLLQWIYKSDEETKKSLGLASSHFWQKKCIRIASKLSQLFQSYSQFATFFWEKPFVHWQKDLFFMLYQQNGWSTHLEKALSLKEVYQQQVIHSFANPYLPPYLAIFFESFAKKRHFFDYFVSPCKDFWEDLPHRKKAKKIDHEQMILTAFGEMTKEGLKQFAEANFSDCFIEDKTTNFTLLKTIQKSLFSLDAKVPPLQEVGSVDSSLQLHEHTSRLREVEGLYHYLLKILMGGMQPKDIVVYAPDIGKYFPIIELVMGESKIPFKVLGLDLHQESFYLKSLFQIFHLMAGRFEKREFIALLQNPAIYQKLGFILDEVEEIVQWIELSSVKWGIDGSHKKDKALSTKDKRELEKKTWKEFFQNLLTSFILPTEEYHFSSQTLRLSWSSYSLFSTLYDFFSRISKEALFLSKNPSFSLQKWATYFAEVADHFCYFDRSIPEEKAGYDSFSQFIRHLRETDLKESSEFSFEEVFSLFSAISNEKKGGYNLHERQAVLFTSLSPGVPPSKCIALLGVDSEFSIAESADHWNLLHQGCFFPKRSEYYRQAFLEVMSRAQQELYISYKSSKERQSASLLEELLFYLQKLLSDEELKDKLLIKHPSYGFHHFYFSEENNCYLPQIYYKAAQKYYGATHAQKSLSLDIDEKEDIITINALKKLAKHPIEFFFKFALHLSIENKLSNREDELLPTFLDRYLFRKEIVNEKENVFCEDLFQKKVKGEGLFANIITKEFQEEHRELRKNLQKLSLSEEVVFSLIFEKQCKAAVHLPSGNWLLPSPKIHYCGKEYYIEGEVQQVTSRGLISYSKKDQAVLLSSWPELLLLNIARQEGIPIDSVLLFIRNATGKEIEITEPKKELTHFIEYYFQAKKRPSPLIRDWLEKIIYEKEIALEKGFLEDPYLEKFFSLYSTQEIEELITSWRPILQKVYAPILESKK